MPVFGITLSASQVGLTLKAQLIDEAGVNVGVAITTNFFEVGIGYYQWFYDLFPSGFQGGIKFLNASNNALLAYIAVNPNDIVDASADFLAVSVPGDYTGDMAGAALGRLFSEPGISIVNPIAQNRYMEIVRGDDYTDANSRAILMTLVPCTWASGAVITFTAVYKTNEFTATMTYVSSVTGGITAKLQLTSNLTANLEPGDRLYDFDVRVTLPTSNLKQTVARGKLTLLEERSA